jgi:hypothetical protein
MRFRGLHQTISDIRHGANGLAVGALVALAQRHGHRQLQPQLQPAARPAIGTTLRYRPHPFIASACRSSRFRRGPLARRARRLGVEPLGRPAERGHVHTFAEQGHL